MLYLVLKSFDSSYRANSSCMLIPLGEKKKKKTSSQKLKICVFSEEMLHVYSESLLSTLRLVTIICCATPCAMYHHVLHSTHFGATALTGCSHKKRTEIHLSDRTIY